MKFTGTAQGACCKRNHLRKVVKPENFTRSFKFLLTGEMYINQSLRKQIRGLLGIGMDDYVEVDTLTQISKFSA